MTRLGDTRYRTGILLLLLFGVGLTIGQTSYAAPPEGKGKPDNPGQQGQGQDKENPGRGRSEEARAEAPARGKSDEARTQASSAAAETRVERQHPHQERRAQAAADRADNANDRIRLASAHGRSGDHGLRGRDAAKAHVDGLLNSLNKLEHARWDYNPHDTRGQGNMGKVNMRDPYGFDKDSGREGRDRGRPIRETEPEQPPAEEPPTEEPPVEEPPLVEEPTVIEEPPLVEGPPLAEEPLVVEEPPVVEESALNLAELVSIEVTDPWIGYLQDVIAFWTAVLAANSDPSSPSYSTWAASYASWMITNCEQQIASRLANPPETYDVVVFYGTDDVNYSLTFQPFEGMEGTTFQVTTQLVSAETVSATGWIGDWDPSSTTYEDYWANEDGEGWQPFSTTYETGQILFEQTEEATLSQDGTYDFSLNTSGELFSGGFFNSYEGVTVDLVVTVTDPASGASYTMTFDSLYRLVDPYGIVYDKATGRPIAGATVTVHHAGGAIVQLDASGNSNVSNPQRTDATGRYSCKLARGKYYLTVKAPGYEEYKSAMFSELGHIVRIDVGMVRARTEPTASLSAPIVTDELMAPSVNPAVLPVK